MKRTFIKLPTIFPISALVLVLCPLERINVNVVGSLAFSAASLYFLIDGECRIYCERCSMRSE